jgi:hypothetical protein
MVTLAVLAFAVVILIGPTIALHALAALIVWLQDRLGA